MNTSIEILVNWRCDKCFVEFRRFYDAKEHEEHCGKVRMYPDGMLDGEDIDSFLERMVNIQSKEVNS